MNAIDFSRAFEQGREIKLENFTLRLERRELGDLTLPSGNLVACDPFLLADVSPFAASVPPGSYPVILSVAHVEETEDQRVAYSMVRFRDDAAVRWQMATLPGEDLETLEEGYLFCYPVDAGTGCFMDAETARLMLANEETFDTLLEEVNKTYTDTWSWANYVVGMVNGQQANIVLFSSGWGDGCYTTYWGYDANDNIAAIVTDFAVVHDVDQPVS